MSSHQSITPLSGGPRKPSPWDNNTDPRQDFHSFWYLNHTFRVLEHLASMNLDLRNKNVLEVSAGIGDFTTFFLDRGCTVHATDSRAPNLAMMKWRFEKEPRVKTFFLDMEYPGTSDLPRGEKYDVVFNYGLLYHLANPKESIEFLVPFAKDLFLLETCVSPGNEEAINLVKEEKVYFSQAMHGTGCRPTRPWIFNQLKRHFPHVYMPTTQPNWKNHPIDWENKSAWSDLTRAIFVASRSPLDNPLLVPEVPMKQTRH